MRAGDRGHRDNETAWKGISCATTTIRWSTAPTLHDVVVLIGTRACIFGKWVVPPKRGTGWNVPASIGLLFAKFDEHVRVTER